LRVANRICYGAQSISIARNSILLQKRRDMAAAKQFFKRVLASCHDVPRKIVTNQ
jgi:putative transposase